MNGSVNRHKSSKLNKVDNNNFKNARKVNINKSLRERRLLSENYSTINQRKRRTKSNKNINDNLLFRKKLGINLDKKETQNISITNKTLKKFLSNSKINTVKFNMLLRKKSGPINENEKEEDKQNLAEYFSPELKNIELKKNISSNNITHLFKSIINNPKDKVINVKKTKLFKKEVFNNKIK